MTRTFHDDTALSLAARHANATEYMRIELMDRGIAGSVATALVNDAGAQVTVLPGGSVRLVSPAGELLSATGEEALLFLAGELAARAKASATAAREDATAVKAARQHVDAYL